MIRRAAILCPGPSLTAFDDRAGHDVRIGVNRAAEAYRCDYWVALDAHTFGMCEPVGRPVLVCRTATYTKMCRRWPAAGEFEHLATNRLPGPRTRSKLRWRAYSATTALVLAAHLRSGSVDCWGVDWAGRADFDGYTHPRQRRDGRRWDRERKIWTALCDLLAADGVTVARPSADPAATRQPA